MFQPVGRTLQCSKKHKHMPLTAIFPSKFLKSLSPSYQMIEVKSKMLRPRMVPSLENLDLLNTQNITHIYIYILVGVFNPFEKY